MLLSPGKATGCNLKGIAYVTSRMDWYCALTELLLEPRNVKSGTRPPEAILQQLEGRVVSLYKALLLYQMKSVYSYYRPQGVVFLRGLINLDDWDSDLKTVTSAEADVRKDWDTYTQEDTKRTLHTLVQNAEEMETRLGDIHHTIQDLIDTQKSAHRDNEETNCRRALCVVDPQDDMKRIEDKKDELLDDAYKWILSTDEYTALTSWDNTGSSPFRRLLWIKGPAGTGKTMLMIGIIRELSRQPVVHAPKLSFFFCQGTDRTLNNATAILRSLTWLLLVQQPHLISHLLQKYRERGVSLFTDMNAFYALREAFFNMLEDPRLTAVYFVIDALDECEEIARMIELISTSLTVSDKVKWLVSSRPTVELKTPDTAGSLVELDAQKLENPVNTYISHKISTLKTREGYDNDILADVQKEVRQRAQNTFLWVALAFKELDRQGQDGYPVHGSYALEIIKEMPSGLSELYGQMMERIKEGQRRDPEYCKNILTTAILANRPLALSELKVLADLPYSMDPKSIIRKCGSFLITEKETVYLIHQSAKDYLEDHYGFKLQEGASAQGNMDIGRRSIAAMSLKLKRNLYDLSFGFKPEDIQPPNPDPLAGLRYSCEFWADHLCIQDGMRFVGEHELTDDGLVSKFLKEHFLHWLESLSLLGKLSAGLQSIKNLLHLTQVCLQASYYLQ